MRFGEGPSSEYRFGLVISNRIQNSRYKRKDKIESLYSNQKGAHVLLSGHITIPTPTESDVISHVQVKV